MTSNDNEEKKPTPRPTIEILLKHISQGSLLETSFPRVELKSIWNKNCGKDISAIANHESQQGGWMIIGIDDQGNPVGTDSKWADKNLNNLGQQINDFLNPSYVLKESLVKNINGNHCIFLEIQNHGDITEWDGEAYKLTGTSSTKMNSNERIKLSLKFPGEDFTKQSWEGKVNNSLVLDFAKKIETANINGFSEDLNNLSSSDVLKRLYLDGKMTSGILFGDFPVRIAYYDMNDDVIENTEKKGLYNILTDDFINNIQTWTKKQGTTLKGNTTSITEENPYPPKMLREIMANATAHSLYQREKGGVIVDINPDRITVRNNAMMGAKLFSKQWFARKTFVKNKLLMTTLRAAKITDELGTGKARIFRLAMEFGKREPIIDFSEHGNHGKWEITIYNHLQYEYLQKLLQRFYEIFPSHQHARIAIALTLWKNKTWKEIKERLDEHHNYIAMEVIEHQYSPVSIVENEIFSKRWIDIALTGQSNKKFDEKEEEKIKKMLKKVAFDSNRKGIIDTKEAKNIIGLGNTPSESTQLSNLFRKWEKEKIIKRINRGKWQFIEDNQDTDMSIIMSFDYDVDMEKFYKKIIDTPIQILKEKK